jgi:tetratricopeptide (TPR) repeat protein
LVKILAGEDNPQEQAIITRAIDEVGPLSFVKRRSDHRIVLHDEMFALLQIHEADYYAPERERILATMETVYKTRIEQIRGQISGLTTTLIESDADKIDQVILDQIIAARGIIQNTILEDLHYRLRRDARKGFQVFYRYIEEAVTEGNELLGQQLQAEVYGFLAERDPFNQLEEVDGLSMVKVKADAAVRQVKWLWAENRVEAALKLVNRLKTEKRALIEIDDDLPLAELDSWHGYLEAYAANYNLATDLIQKAIDRIKLRPMHTPRSAGMLARAYNNSGYVYRLEGRTHQAIEAYQQALGYWRAAYFRTAQADTLNNLAYASALIGDFEAADRYGRDGLNLRKEIGPSMPTGLSLTTLAVIDILSNYLDRGLRRSQRAYNLFSTLNNTRGIGMAQLTLAEAKRRISDSTPYQKQGQTAQLLAEAGQHATEAARIFTEQSPETDYRAASLIELGCAFRDWALLRQKDSAMLAEDEQITGQFHSVANLVIRSEQTFQKALQAAGNIDDLRADILLNLALLNYLKGFRLNLVPAEKIITLLTNQLFPQIENVILNHYRQRISLNDLTELFALKEGTLFSVFSGRLELLRAHIAFSQFSQSDNRNLDHLREAAWHFTLALAYLGLYSDKDFRLMRRARQQVYERFTKLKAQELNVVFESVAAVEKQYQWETSLMGKFLESNFGLTGTISMIDA